MDHHLGWPFATEREEAPALSLDRSSTPYLAEPVMPHRDALLSEQAALTSIIEDLRDYVKSRKNKSTSISYNSSNTQAKSNAEGQSTKVLKGGVPAETTPTLTSGRAEVIIHGEAHESVIAALENELDQWKAKAKDSAIRIQIQEGRILALEKQQEEKFKAHDNIFKAAADKIQDFETQVKKLKTNIVNLREERSTAVKEKSKQLEEALASFRDYEQETTSKIVQLEKNYKRANRKKQELEFVVKELREKARKELANEQCVHAFVRAHKNDPDKVTVVIPTHFDVKAEDAGGVLEHCIERQKEEGCKWIDWYAEYKEIDGYVEEEEDETSSGKMNEEKHQSEEDDEGGRGGSDVTEKKEYGTSGCRCLLCLMGALEPQNEEREGSDVVPVDEEEQERAFNPNSYHWNGPLPSHSNAHPLPVYSVPVGRRDVSYEYKVIEQNLDEANVYIPGTGAEHAGRRSRRGLRAFSRRVQHGYNKYTG